MTNNVAGTPAWMSSLPGDLQGGSASSFSVAIAEFDVGDESTVTPVASGVTALVGGNNVGKSTALRELVNYVHRHDDSRDPSQKIIGRISVERKGSPADLIDWLGENAVARSVDNYLAFYRAGVHQQVAAQDLARTYGQPNDAGLGYLAAYCVHYSSAMQRTANIDPVAMRDPFDAPPTHPIHYLQDNEELLDEFSSISSRIFQMPITLDNLSASARLRVGRVSVDAPPVDRVTATYREALAQLPFLGEQGDGMKSMLGLLLPILTATYPIIVIDEPEAFLHPPQAYELGRTISRLAADRGLQVILATHDRNLLTGLLDSKAPVSVVHLRRTGNRACASQLDSAHVESLWTDPILRHSNVLEGLFHKLVVVAEGDQDCRFYRATLEELPEAISQGIGASEVLLVPSNGKDGMAKIVRALRAVDVAVAVSPDLDILDDEGKLRNLVEAFGVEWSELAPLWKKVSAPFQKQTTSAKVSDILSAIELVLRPHESEIWSQDLRSKLVPHLRASKSKWDEVKSFGMDAFKGETAKFAADLVDGLANIGICCVKRGELERLAPTLGVAKGPGWLPAALAAQEHENEYSRGHVAWILAKVAKGRDRASE